LKAYDCTNINELDSEDRCLKTIIKENYTEIKQLPMVKEFIKEKDNYSLLMEAFEKGEAEIISKLNSSFRKFIKKQQAINYGMGVIKRYPIDYDKRVKKRNNRCMLILDKPVKNSDESSTASFLELVQDNHQEDQLSKTIFKESIFEMKNEKLKNIISSLSSYQQKLLYLIYEETYTQREASKILGQTEQNIYYWHKKTIKYIKAELAVI
jgi:RNA polymerase sigma factor (sigma-70 family)